MSIAGRNAPLSHCVAVAFTPKPSIVWKRTAPSTSMVIVPAPADAVGAGVVEIVGVGVVVGPGVTSGAGPAYIDVRCGQLPAGLKLAGKLVTVLESPRSGFAAMGSTRVTRLPPASASRAIQ